jgi:Tol biopolymer transport system component
VITFGQAGTRPETALRAAMELETVKGDLQGAIQRYSRLAESKDRAVAATALLRMAQCHEKLGNAEARNIYERVVRDFADQKDAVAIARVKLGGTGAGNAGIVTRQVWTGPNVDADGTVSPDGRYLSCVDWDTGDLRIRDLVADTERRLTNKGRWADSNEHAEESAISRDGRLVAYSWFNNKRRYELRIANLSGDPAPRSVFDNADVQWLAPSDWTADGKWIAVQVQRQNGAKQIGLVSATDGSLRVLKAIYWRAGGKMALSPDGKYLAYDISPDESGGQRDIFLLGTDGSGEKPAVVHAAHDYVMGWSPDGSHLLFGSDRNGSIGVWALEIANGKPQGSPRIIRPDIGRAHSLGLTRSGAMYYRLTSASEDIYVAPIDFGTGRVVSPPMGQGFIGSISFPAWSPDGKYLSYTFFPGERGGASRGSVLRMRSMDTGRIREIRWNLLQGIRPRWAPNSRSLVVSSADTKGRQGIFRVDIETEAVTPIVLSEPGIYSHPIGWSPDGNKLIYRRGDVNNDNVLVIERDMTSGGEREVLRGQGITPADAVSTDGRNYAYVTFDRAAKTHLLRVVPIEGGQSREVLRLKHPDRIANTPGLVWSKDGRSILFEKRSEKNPWMVSVSDGKSKRLDLNMLNVRHMQLHPDGRRLVFISGDTRLEVWVMENFLPALSAKK